MRVSVTLYFYNKTYQSNFVSKKADCGPKIFLPNYHGNSKTVSFGTTKFFFYFSIKFNVDNTVILWFLFRKTKCLFLMDIVNCKLFDREIKLHYNIPAFNNSLRK